MSQQGPDAHQSTSEDQGLQEAEASFPVLHEAVMGMPFGHTVNNAFLTWLMLDVVLPTVSKTDTSARSYVAETLIILTHELPDTTSDSLVTKGPFPDVDGMTSKQMEFLADAAVAARRSSQKAFVGNTVDAVSYATSAVAFAKLATDQKPASTSPQRAISYREAAYAMIHNKLVEMTEKAQCLEAAKPPRKPVSFLLGQRPSAG